MTLNSALCSHGRTRERARAPTRTRTLIRTHTRTRTRTRTRARTRSRTRSRSRSRSRTHTYVIFLDDTSASDAPGNGLPVCCRYAEATQRSRHCCSQFVDVRGPPVVDHRRRLPPTLTTCRRRGKEGGQLLTTELATPRTAPTHHRRGGHGPYWRATYDREVDVPDARNAGAPVQVRPAQPSDRLRPPFLHFCTFAHEPGVLVYQYECARNYQPLAAI